MRQPGRRDDGGPFDPDADPLGWADRGDRSAVPPGTRPGGARGVAPAVAVIAVLIVAVAVGGLAEAPAPNPYPSTPATPNTAAVQDCEPASLTAIPEFTLGIAGGTGAGIGGSIGTTFLPDGIVPGLAWPVPDPDPGRDVPVVAPETALEIRSPAACVRRINAEYVPATLERAPFPADRRTLTSGVVEPPSPSPGLGALPDGDWVVRVEAYLETGVGGRDGKVTGERFFRVRVGSPPFPTQAPRPGPEVTPDVACGPPPTTADEVVLTLTAPGGRPAVGAYGGFLGELVTVELPLGEAGTLAVVGDACARSWNVSVLNAETGLPFRTDVVTNPTDDPDHASQNRWRVSSTVGDFFLVAELHFGRGIDVARVWRIRSAEFTVPETLVVADDGRRVAALPGCGLTYELPNGYSVTDACDQFRFPEGVGLLRVPAWSRVVLEVPGWAITTWDGWCGRLEQDAFLGVQIFTEAEFCPLGGFSVPDGDTPPGPVQFLARPGELAIRIHVRAERNDTTYDGQMYARVAGE